MRSVLMAALLGAAALPLFCAPPKAKPAKAAKAPKSKIAPPSTSTDLPPAGASGELLDPAAGRGKAIGPMAETRSDFQATPMPDGRVLVTGGSLRGPSSEWFDPATRRFSPGPAMVQVRQGHTALLLKDGRLLVLGGTENPSAAEVLEVGATKFTALSKDALFGLSAEALDLGAEEGVMLIDGMGGRCWLWDGQKKFKGAGSLSNPRLLFRAAKLADGRVLICGGWPAPPQEPVNRNAPRRPVRSAPSNPQLPIEVYNPKKFLKWSTWKAQALARARHQVLPLSEGRLLLLGGFGASAEQNCETLEVLDPAKESVTSHGSLPKAWGNRPAFLSTETGTLLLAERSAELRKGSDALELLKQGSPAGKLSNAFQEPSLVPLKSGAFLVLGAAQWGPSLERWDPRTRQFTYVGALRVGTETLGLLDGKVIAVGGGVDVLDPKTGVLSPLGWRNEVELAKAKLYTGPGNPKLPDFPDGQPRSQALLVDLGLGKGLILGGKTPNSPQGTDQAWVWDLKKKKLEATGNLKSKRLFPDPMRPGEGALKLADGSVLVWGMDGSTL